MATAPTRHELEAKIVKKCWTDEAFRKEFTSNPVGTCVKYLNVPANQVPKIVIHEEPAGSWHIVVPAKPVKSQELSDDDLEQVAGGTAGLTITITLQVTTAVPTLPTAGKGAW